MDITIRKKISTIPDGFRERLRIDLGRLEPFADWVSKKFKDSVEYKSSDIRFSSEREAEEFTNQAVAYAQQRVDGLLFTSRKYANQKVKDAHLKLKEFLDQEMKFIVERARIRLNRSFNVTLSIPDPVLDISDDYLIKKPQIARETREVDQGYEDIKVRRKDIFSLFGLLPIYITKKQKRPNRKESYYSVSLSALILEINQSIEASIATLGKSLDDYFDKDFQERIDFYFNELDDYLNNFKDSLVQAQKDGQLDAEKKNKLVEHLRLYSSDAIKQIEDCKKYLERANSLIPASTSEKY